MSKVYYCTGCAKPMETTRPDGSVHQEGWYYWDGGTYCTGCWQRLGFYEKADQAAYPRI